MPAVTPFSDEEVVDDGSPVKQDSHQEPSRLPTMYIYEVHSQYRLRRDFNSRKRYFSDPAIVARLNSQPQMRPPLLILTHPSHSNKQMTGQARRP